MTVYISIGNSDDRLTQARWSEFWSYVDEAIRSFAPVIHGSWVSDSRSPWQNACWCIAVTPDTQITELKGSLRVLAARFDQESIAWAEVTETSFIGEGPKVALVGPSTYIACVNAG